jgi:hypothetical protein
MRRSVSLPAKSQPSATAGPGAGRRRALQRLAALAVAPLLPFSARDVFAASASTLNALPRVALVIGNGSYRTAPLRNPANDADAISADLKKLGFAVISRLDADKRGMEEAIQNFGSQLAKNKAVGLFYFAGHGLQVNWRNFLVPVDAALGKADDVPGQTVDMTIVLDSIARAGNPMNIIIVDACRDNPFGGELKSGKGLSQMDAPIGTLLAYATAPGNVASDGSGSNSLYTENLLRELRTPEARIEDVFKRVRLNVRRASQGQQIPWESTSLEEDFYFMPPASLKKLSQEELDRQFAEEAEAWGKARDTAEPAAMEAYLRRYPSGRFSELAQMRLDRILARQGERKIRVISDAANPFSKGTAVNDLDYHIGDRFVFRTIDLLTKIEAGRRIVQVVTAVTDGEVIYNNGAYITDLLGNALKWPDGSRFGASQFYVGEYSVGKKWTTRYSADYANGHKDAVEYDFKVVGTETVTVPAGTFDTFRVEGYGWVIGAGVSLHVKYWVAPDKVRRAIAVETLWRNKGNRITKSDRNELVAHSQRSKTAA